MSFLSTGGGSGSVPSQLTSTSDYESIAYENDDSPNQSLTSDLQEVLNSDNPEIVADVIDAVSKDNNVDFFDSASRLAHRIPDVFSSGTDLTVFKADYHWANKTSVNGSNFYIEDGKRVNEYSNFRSQMDNTRKESELWLPDALVYNPLYEGDDAFDPRGSDTVNHQSGDRASQQDSGSFTEINFGGRGNSHRYSWYQPHKVPITFHVEIADFYSTSGGGFAILGNTDTATNLSTDDRYDCMPEGCYWLSVPDEDTVFSNEGIEIRFHDNNETNDNSVEAGTSNASIGNIITPDSIPFAVRVEMEPRQGNNGFTFTLEADSGITGTYDKSTVFTHNGFNDGRQYGDYFYIADDNAGWDIPDHEIIAQRP